MYIKNFKEMETFFIENIDFCCNFLLLTPHNRLFSLNKTNEPQLFTTLFITYWLQVMFKGDEVAVNAFIFRTVRNSAEY